MCDSKNSTIVLCVCVCVCVCVAGPGVGLGFSLGSTFICPSIYLWPSGHILMSFKKLNFPFDGVGALWFVSPRPLLLHLQCRHLILQYWTKGTGHRGKAARLAALALGCYCFLNFGGLGVGALMV